MKRRLGEILLAVYFALAPSTAPEWRWDPETRPVAVLAVGSPTPRLDRYRLRRASDTMAPPTSS